MRLSLVSTLALSITRCTLAGGPGAAKSSADDVIDSLFHVRHLSEVSISPVGSHVGWVQISEDPATGASTLSIYVADLRKPGGAPRRITAGDGAGEYHEHEIAWSPD